jgi:hypothetical protein
MDKVQKSSNSEIRVFLAEPIVPVTVSLIPYKLHRTADLSRGLHVHRETFLSQVRSKPVTPVLTDHAVTV